MYLTVQMRLGLHIFEHIILTNNQINRRKGKILGIIACIVEVVEILHVYINRKLSNITTSVKRFFASY